MIHILKVSIPLGQFQWERLNYEKLSAVLFKRFPLTLQVTSAASGSVVKTLPKKGCHPYPLLTTALFRNRRESAQSQHILLSIKAFIYYLFLVSAYFFFFWSCELFI